MLKKSLIALAVASIVSVIAKLVIKSKFETA